ncbi:MAG: DUF2783 domain-containing protein [Geminicoccaceae bacterium]|nr:DUF2783 domain-containing protein [Geminicoccaceae bacterium]MCS7269047.1 DUF2783 domain-containing protein [Geminicoccaceae bacterium]MCX7631005.1 DUF2783 domain-containing protein [Geminicoccaceae bacterium]MDW8125451.1 DUF2783 domain-containing protein [Geminicoccaceae bacterium]MDW8341976.1 DUF2783 domain-containing protein [Geminicoccaceae bacterium]
MAELDTQVRLRDPDAVFVRLVRAHRDLAPEQSRRLDAALVLLLANQLGDEELLERAIAAARAAVLGEEAAP